MSPDTRSAEEGSGHENTDGDAARDPGGTDPLADALAEPLADPDAGVAVDDDPGQVDLNSEQWDTE
jgi:hypothetical protein